MTKILALSNYEDLTFHQAFRLYYDDLGISNFKHWDKLFVDMAKEENLKTYLLLDNDVIVGFIQCQNIELEHWFFTERIGFIREFWIYKDVRNQGNGNRLFDFAIKQFASDGLKKIILTSENGETFYKNRGFIIDESYTALNNDFVMVMSINSSLPL